MNNLLKIVIILVFAESSFPAFNLFADTFSDNYSGNNFKVYPGSLNQVETSVFNNPNNPNIFSASAITDYYQGGYTTGFYISTNGGFNWTGTDHIVDAFGTTIVTIGDPIILISGTGNYILSYITSSQAGSLGIGVRYSSNIGSFWSPQILVPNVDTSDKPISGIDNNISSPYYGRVYIAYGELNFDQSECKGIYFSYSTNSGISWDSSKAITSVNPTYKFRLSGDVTCASNGNVFVMWYSNSEFIGISKSINGGINWSLVQDNAIGTNAGCLSYVYNDSVLLNNVPSMDIDKSGGQREGWIYVVSVEFSNDSLDVILHRSSNEGTSWSTAIPVNQDNSGSFKIQAMPSIVVDKYGGINVLYYDSRNSISNDSFDVYLSRSVNGGNTFFDTKISNHKFKFKQPGVTLFGYEGYVGSYTGISSNSGYIVPLWYDNSSGVYQAWTTSIELLPNYNIKAFPEGFYDISTSMLRMKDTINVFIRNKISPYAKIDSAKGTIDSVNFMVSLKFHSNLNPDDYYIEIQHRNSIATWSSIPVNYSFGSKVNYDFVITNANAFGDNEKLIDGKWGMFSGDVNKDDLIDVSDLVDIYNSSLNLDSGYVREDINGDLFVDASDILICYNNVVNLVGVISP